MPELFENGKKFDGENLLQDFDAKEMYLRHKNRSVSFQKRRKMFCSHHFGVFTRCRFEIVKVKLQLLAPSAGIVEIEQTREK